jgi:dTDP-4-amino-4,6-dideoxygalactose transaminase
MLLHLTQPYRQQGHQEGECPVAEVLVDRHVTLPIHPRLTDDAIDYMADCIVEIAGRQ